MSWFNSKYNKELKKARLFTSFLWTLFLVQFTTNWSIRIIISFLLELPRIHILGATPYRKSIHFWLICKQFYNGHRWTVFWVQDFLLKVQLKICSHGQPQKLFTDQSELIAFQAKHFRHKTVLTSLCRTIIQCFIVVRPPGESLFMSHILIVVDLWQ